MELQTYPLVSKSLLFNKQIIKGWETTAHPTSTLQKFGIFLYRCWGRRKFQVCAYAMRSFLVLLEFRKGNS